MNDAPRYRAKAAECLEAASRASDERKRANLIAMAQAWIALAGQADRNSHTDIVYETPPPSRKPPGRHVQ
jgi:hypothetical protein